MNLGIGLSGLRVAQEALAIISTNIANANTEGYHKQTPNVESLEFRGPTGANLAGARIQGIIRHMDALLEQELLRQSPTYGEVSQELQSLRSLEIALGDMDSESLPVAMSRFFSSLQELAGQPDSVALREQTVWAGDGLAGQFHNLSGFLDGLSENVRLEATVLVDRVNSLADRVVGLNAEIRDLELKGVDANLLRDKRDQALKEIAELVPIQTESIDPTKSMSDVMAWGIALVTGARAMHLEVNTTADGDLAVSIAGADYYVSDYRGGRLGALLGLKNDLLPQVKGDLDAMAEQIAWLVNRAHAQGVGTHGSFTDLQGVAMSSPVLADWVPPITSGDFNIRLVDPSGQGQVLTVAVDAATDTLATVAAKIAALDPAHLTAGIAASAIRIQALGGYEFDFLPVMTADTSALAAPDAPQITPEGIYTGSANQTYTVTVGVEGGGSGQVGITGGLTLTARDASGAVVRVLNVGAGYASGDLLEIQNGAKLSLGPGTLNDGETFTVRAVANSDETGFLAAAGLNTFFQGYTAGTIQVRQELLDDPNLLATGLGPEMNDNVAALRMSEVGSIAVAALGDASPMAAYRILASSIGQKIVVREAKLSSIEDIRQQLNNQRDSVSGVDVNEEAARMIIFEQMFQAMAKVISTQRGALQTLMELL